VLGKLRLRGASLWDNVSKERKLEWVAEGATSARYPSPFRLGKILMLTPMGGRRTTAAVAGTSDSGLKHRQADFSLRRRKQAIQLEEIFIR